MENFKLMIVEDVPLELKGTEGIVRHEIPEAEVIGTATNEVEYWRLIKKQQPDLVLLDLGLGHHCGCGDLPAYQGAVSAGESTDLHW